MPRTRNIKPAFFDNDVLGGLEPLTRLLFIGLWCIADREGRLEDRPRRIKKTLLGYDDVNTEETSGMLQQLADNGFIIRYTVEEDDYIQIVNFTKHQNPHMKEKDSEIPPPPGFEAVASDKNGASTRQAPCKNDETENNEEPEEVKPSLQEQRFNAFWQAYPNKKAKQAAWKAWQKIKPTTELFERIISAVDNAKRSEDWLRDNGRYIPHPATWLTGGRWDDELTEASPTTAHTRNTGAGATDTMGVLGSIIEDEEGGGYNDTF